MFDICLRVSAVGGDQRELLLSEGTVILHITFALKQDQVWNITPDPRNTYAPDIRIYPKQPGTPINWGPIYLYCINIFSLTSEVHKIVPASDQVDE